MAVFARYPRLGSVKTRLAPLLSDAGCLRLHQALLWDTVERTSELEVARYLFLADCSRDELLQLEEMSPVRGRWNLKLQQGRNLGERLLKAHDLLRKSHSRVAFLGSDSPTVPLGWIELAFESLSASPVVIGPTTDGGYYLLGLAKARPQVFKGIDWGTQRVLQQTQSKLPPEELKLLPVWHDVDEPPDLKQLREDLDRWPPGQAGFPQRTAAFVKGLSEAVGCRL